MNTREEEKEYSGRKREERKRVWVGGGGLDVLVSPSADVVTVEEGASEKG